MKIELKRFTTNARLSQETTAFAADVWVDGKKAGHAENDGHGGNTNVHLHLLAPEQRAAVEAHCKALVPAEYASFTSGTEWAVDQLVEAEVQKREDAKFAKRVAKADQQGRDAAKRAGKRVGRYMHDTGRGEAWEYFMFAEGQDADKVAADLAKKKKKPVVVKRVVVL